VGYIIKKLEKMKKFKFWLTAFGGLNIIIFLILTIVFIWNRNEYILKSLETSFIVFVLIFILDKGFDK